MEQIRAQPPVALFVRPEIERHTREVVHQRNGQSVLREVDGLQVPLAAVTRVDRARGRTRRRYRRARRRIAARRRLDTRRAETPTRSDTARRAASVSPRGLLRAGSPTPGRPEQIGHRDARSPDALNFRPTVRPPLDRGRFGEGLQHRLHDKRHRVICPRAIVKIAVIDRPAASGAGASVDATPDAPAGASRSPPWQAVPAPFPAATREGPGRPRMRPSRSTVWMKSGVRRRTGFIGYERACGLTCRARSSVAAPARQAGRSEDLRYVLMKKD